MIKKLTILLVLVWAGVGWGQVDWGGSTWQDPDSIDATSSNSTNNLNNYGIQVSLSTTRNGTDVWTNVFYARFKNDPHTSGYTQDSAFMVLVYNELGSDPDAVNDSSLIYFYVLKKDWGEGTKNNATATSGEASWDSAQTGTVAWTGATGGSNTADRQATVACSLWIIDDPSADIVCTLKIEGTHLTQDFFDYGLIGLQQGTSQGATSNFHTFSFWSDNNTTASNRPYFYGYETAPAAGGGTTAGAATVGAATVGSQ